MNPREPLDERVSDWLEGRLDPQEARALEQELAREGRLEEARELARMVRLLEKAPGEKAPPGLAERVYGKIVSPPAPQVPPAAGTGRFLPWFLSAAAAAAAALLVYLTLPSTPLRPAGEGGSRLEMARRDRPPATKASRPAPAERDKALPPPAEVVKKVVLGRDSLEKDGREEKEEKERSRGAPPEGRRAVGGNDLPRSLLGWMAKKGGAEKKAGALDEDLETGRPRPAGKAPAKKQLAGGAGKEVSLGGRPPERTGGSRPSIPRARRRIKFTGPGETTLKDLEEAPLPEVPGKNAPPTPATPSGRALPPGKPAGKAPRLGGRGGAAARKKSSPAGGAPSGAPAGAVRRGRALKREGGKGKAPSPGHSSRRLLVLYAPDFADLGFAAFQKRGGKTVARPLGPGSLPGFSPSPPGKVFLVTLSGPKSLVEAAVKAAAAKARKVTSSLLPLPPPPQAGAGGLTVEVLVVLEKRK